MTTRMIPVALLLSTPALAAAQRRAAPMAHGDAKHEFGVDIGVAYSKPNGVDGGLLIGTPLDVRVGLRSSGKMMWEPRFTFSFSSVGGTTVYALTPGVNVLFAQSPGGHANGMYFTGGGGLILADVGGSSGTALSLNGGIGWRKPYGSGAWRYEVGVQYNTESTSIGLPSTLNIGGRIGISLWH